MIHRARGSVIMIALAMVAGSVILPGGLAEDTSVTVANVAPVVNSVSLADDTLTPTAGSTTSATATITVEDVNGCNDLVDVRPDVNTPDNATTLVDGGSLLQTWDSCTLGVATYTWTFQMQYYHDPATSSGYNIYVVAEDASGVKTNNALDVGSLLTFTYAELAALNLNQTTVDFGSGIEPDATTSPFTLGVENYGNVQIDVSLSGASLDHATEDASIAASNVKYHTAKTLADASDLSGTSTTVTAFDLAKGSGSSSPLYWWLAVPSGADQWIPSGDYSGTVTVSAVKG